MQLNPPLKKEWEAYESGEFLGRISEWLGPEPDYEKFDEYRGIWLGIRCWRSVRVAVTSFLLLRTTVPCKWSRVEPGTSGIYPEPSGYAGLAKGS